MLSPDTLKDIDINQRKSPQWQIGDSSFANLRERKMEEKFQPGVSKLALLYPAPLLEHCHTASVAKSKAPVPDHSSMRFTKYS